MTDPKRVLWYLRKVPLLADLGPDAVARMAERVELREARRRDVVYLPGDPGKSLFFVHGGRIKVSKVTRDGKSLTLAYHGPAELFGDSCLLDGGPRTEMAEAVENALLSEIDRAHFFLFPGPFFAAFSAPRFAFFRAATSAITSRASLKPVLAPGTPT